MEPKQALIVFQKNADIGKVKTRLAAAIGEEKALNVYLKLIQKCFRHLSALQQVDIFIFYTDRFEQIHQDIANLNVFQRLQTAGDLGEKMLNAFESVHNQGYSHIAIIGTDCPGLSAAIISDAFSALAENDVVFGPALDGGYYLLGMKAVHPLLFGQMTWSTSTVLQHSLERCQSAGLKTHLLTRLRDVDTEADWLYFAPLFDSEDEQLFRNN
jgi:uncharacterized protein